MTLVCYNTVFPKVHYALLPFPKGTVDYATIIER